MEQSENTAEDTPQPRNRKRRYALIAVVVLLLAGLVFTIPLINVSRYRRRIASSMSQSLGRPVHLDNVSLHVLPWPGLTLQNLVVSEDPAFGYEPVIRANKVVATLRIGSLWRRQIEFSTIRFVVDEHGSGPSVNLVRNAAGRWNLEQVLMQASRIDIAPTEQRTAGPAPRFPYIQATGARINIKVGNEKMPYSLTDTDFALWLPSAQQWRVRLQGKPMRTDSNVSDAGVLRVEGSMHRADHVAELPVDMHASWRNAPLGEASQLLTGEDANWRGTLFLETSLVGVLGNAKLTTHLQLNDLRRAEFVPSNLMDITVDCAATADVAKTALTDTQCNVPIDGSTPLTLTSAAVDLQHPEAAAADLKIDKLPLHWVFDLSRLVTPRLPASLQPAGTVQGELNWTPDAHGWTGKVSATVPSESSSSFFQRASTPASATELNFDVDTSLSQRQATAPLFRLQPVALHPSPTSSFTLTGHADAKSYELQLAGNGTVAQVHTLAGIIPPLGQGLDKALLPNEHADATHADTPHNIAVTCSLPWGGAQTCTQTIQTEPTKHPARPHRKR